MSEQGSSSAISRRRFLRDATTATVAASGALAGPAPARAPRATQPRQTVAVFGGGIAGLTVAHELAERGFDVTVYERRAWGGKARSTEVPGSATGGRRPLPGEHGFRVFFGFYQNTVDTLRRIPFESNPQGAFDNLVALPQLMFARDGGRHDLALAIGAVDPAAYTPQEILDLIVGVLLETKLPADAVAWFASRLVIYLSSCDARRTGQWENETWTNFTRADRYGEDYRRILINTFTEFVQASKASTTSANFPCHVLECFVYNLLGLNSNGPLIRALNRPTNEAFIDPWLGVLRGLGIGLRNHHELTGFELRGGRISGARVRSRHGASTVRADWYVCALPVERARRMWSPAILAADPQLARMQRLDTDWMSGMKFFLRARTPITKGTIGCADSPWAVTIVTQGQFWPVDFAATYGDGRAHDCLSAIVANWSAPGILYGKPARECSPDEVVSEVWEQIKRHVNDTGRAVLTDDLLLSSDIDPGMLRRNGRLVCDDPLVLPSAGQRPDRPDVTTAIPNLLLAGDYLKSEAEVANMDAASYNARRAANAILDGAGSHETPAKVIGTYRPPEWEPLKRIDAQRYARGQPHVLDIHLPLAQLRTLLGQTEKVLSSLRP
ncbi:MAG: hypothetical protein QOH83_2746 [Solirubrobacteraceae bacterium]|nr:hypothetical protein [Solirubrobacteraceae bacterium]